MEATNTQDERSTPPVIIAILGHDNSGKDTVAEALTSCLATHGYYAKRFSFADRMKVEVADALGSLCGPRMTKAQVGYLLNSRRRADPMVRALWTAWAYWRRQIAGENVYTSVLEAEMVRQCTNEVRPHWLVISDVRRAAEIEFILALAPNRCVFLRTEKADAEDDRLVNEYVAIAGEPSALAEWQQRNPFRWLAAATDWRYYAPAAAAENVGIPSDLLFSVNTRQSVSFLRAQLPTLVATLTTKLGVPHE